MADNSPRRALPARPSLEYLKKLAKDRLAELRRDDPAAGLAAAQRRVAQEHGFASWRALKAHVESLNDAGDAFVHAVEAGDLPALRRLLDDMPALANAAIQHRQARVLPTDTRAMRPLHVAVAADRIEVVNLLLDRGADPDLRNADGRTPLHDALELGRDAIARALRQRGATVDICAAAVLGELDRVRDWLRRDPSLADDRSTHLSPIGWASFGGHTEVIRLLIEHGAAAATHETLWPAAQTGQTELARQLIALGVDVNGRHPHRGRAPLHACGMMHYTSDASGVARVLLDAGADVNAVDAGGATPLMVALDDWSKADGERRAGLSRVIRVLHDAGGNEAFNGDHRRSLVGDATTRGDAGVLGVMLDLHPSLIDTLGGPWNQPLLHRAATRGHLEVVDLLLARGFDVNTTDAGDNACAMHHAAENGRLDVVRRLADAGGDIHGRGDDHELGVLGWATCFGRVHRDVADYLLSRGAQLHIFSAIALDRADDVRRIVRDDPTRLRKHMSRNEHERQPLHHAVRCDQPEMVKLLLELGADVNAQDRSGATPVSYAQRGAMHNGILRLLLDAGAELDLLGALTFDRLDEAEALLAADPARLGPDGRDANALHLAAQRNVPGAVRWLLDHGMDVNARRFLHGCNMTALHLCAEQGRVEPARVLLDAGIDTTITDDTHHADALGWAEYCNQPAMAELIRAAREKGAGL